MRFPLRWLLGDPEEQSGPDLLRTLRRGDDALRVQAARRLAEAPEPQAGAALAALLADPLPGVRRAAARGLGYRGDAAHAPALAARLGSEACAAVLIDAELCGAVELARRLGSDDSLGEAPRPIMLAPLARREVRRRLAAAGLDEVVGGPVHQRRLLEALHRVLEPAAPAAPLRPPPAPAPALASSMGQTRVLLAEDNPVNQLVAIKMLEAIGCQVDVASDGLEAVRMAAGGDYELLMMDCQMPEMDGYEATAANRAAELPGARLPIVAMTANAMQDDRRRCLEVGMDDYLSKPVRAARLREMVQRWSRRDAA